MHIVEVGDRARRGALHQEFGDRLLLYPASYVAIAVGKTCATPCPATGNPTRTALITSSREAPAPWPTARAAARRFRAGAPQARPGGPVLRSTCPRRWPRRGYGRHPSTLGRAGKLHALRPGRRRSFRLAVRSWYLLRSCPAVYEGKFPRRRFWPNEPSSCFVCLLRLFLQQPLVI